MNESVKLNYDDITIVPARVSGISSRSECDPYDGDGFLPLWGSCMSTVVSMENVIDFNDSLIRIVLPRTYPITLRLEFMISASGRYNFTAFSLQEAREIFIEGKYEIDSDWKSELPDHTLNICIDLANGHMAGLLKCVSEIKATWGDRVCIMTGNIANPETYIDYETAGVDYARCSIGTGSACITSSCVGVHYAPFSLLQEIYEIKKSIGGRCKIIADGGIREYRDIQKALLYADSVMIGGLFNKAIESAGKTTYGKRYWNVRGYKILRPITTILTYGKEIPRKDFDQAFKLFKEGKLDIWKKFFGMASKAAQEEINQATKKTGKKLKTSEGLVKYQKVEFSLRGWAENETDYLRSAMSYTDSRTLGEYHDKSWVRITKPRYNK